MRAGAHLGDNNDYHSFVKGLLMTCRCNASPSFPLKVDLQERPRNFPKVSLKLLLVVITWGGGCIRWVDAKDVAKSYNVQDDLLP